MDYDKYVVKSDKEDLLSSLKALDKTIIKEKLKEYEVDNIYKLKDAILNKFELWANSSKDNIFAKLYFKRLMEYENYHWTSTFGDEVELLFVFLYDDDHSYYVPTEIKEIINKVFKIEQVEEYWEEQNLMLNLDEMQVKDLKEMGKFLQIDKLSNKSKIELCMIIYRALTNQDKLTDLIGRFTTKEFDLLKLLMKNCGRVEVDGDREEQNFLCESGLGLLLKEVDGDRYYFCIFKASYDVIKKIDLESLQKKVEDNTKLYDLVRAMVELYGVVSKEDVEYCYNFYYGNGNNLDVPFDFLLPHNRDDNICILSKKDNLYFIHKDLNEESLDIINNIIEKHEYINRKPIKLKDLLKYSNDDYYERTEAKNKLKKYLKKQNIKPEIIEIIIKILSRIYRMSDRSEIEDSVKVLHDFRVEVNKKNIQEIIGYLTEIYDNTRVWENNGWTFNEMKNS